MRLIDADEFIVNLKDYIDKPMTAGLCGALVELAPTAYDVDKAAKELEDYLGDTNFEKSTKDVNESFYKGMSFAYGKAIEIVKQGVVSDDVCEWREEGLFLYTSCGAKVNAYSDEFKYCPYCGMKIEMVENGK